MGHVFGTSVDRAPVECSRNTRMQVVVDDPALFQQHQVSRASVAREDETGLIIRIPSTIGYCNIGTVAKSVYASGSIPGFCSDPSPGADCTNCAGIHCYPNVKDGIFGNRNSWIPNYQLDGDHFVGLGFESPLMVDGFAISRDLLSNSFADRFGGVYKIQYTWDPVAAQDSTWSDAGTFRRTDQGLYAYRFSSPVMLQNIRMKLEGNFTFQDAPCIDEFQVLLEDSKCGEFQPEGELDAAGAAAAKAAGAAAAAAGAAAGMSGSNQAAAAGAAAAAAGESAGLTPDEQAAVAGAAAAAAARVAGLTVKKQVHAAGKAASAAAKIAGLTGRDRTDAVDDAEDAAETSGR